MMTVNPDLPPNYTLQDLESLKSDSAYYDIQTQFSTIRAQAVQQAAQALGMQAGLSYESKQLDQVLDGKAPTLDQIFDFNRVLYQHNVLPPILDKANNQVNINGGGDQVRIAGVTYRILAPVRFVTAPPTWRDYLWMAYPIPQLPDKVLLPQNDQEAAIWQANVAQGWNQGINQAVSIFNLNLSRMVRDFNGMVLYKQLLAQNMVSPYHLVHEKQGITGDAQHMVVDDQTMKITAQPQLQLQSKFWEAAPLSIEKPAPVPLPATPAPQNLQLAAPSSASPASTMDAASIPVSAPDVQAKVSVAPAVGGG